MNNFLKNVEYAVHQYHKNEEDISRDGQVIFVILVLLISSLASSPSWAEQIILIPPNNNNTSDINSSAISGNQGIATVNVTAGDLNSQANVGVLSVGQDIGDSLSKPVVEQNIQKLNNQAPDKAVAKITGHAFSGSSGWTAINQISGQANMQANIMVIGIGGEFEIDPVSDELLAQSYTGTGVTGTASANQRPERSAAIDDTALRGITGVVQVNQAAGARNTTSNTFVFQVSGN